MLLNIYGIRLAVPAETIHSIVDCKAAVLAGMETVRSNREKLNQEIKSLEQTERELIGRAAVLQSEVAKSDAAATSLNSVNTRLEAIRREIAPLREKLESIAAATPVAAESAVAAIVDLHNIAAKELMADFIAALGVPSALTTLLSGNCHPPTIGRKLVNFNLWQESTEDCVNYLFSLLDFAAEGRLYPPAAGSESAIV